MRNPETLLRVYEELASRFTRQNEPRFRDHCLVLAADAALSAQRPQDAERLRQRLLQHNPHHLLRPFASMTEAMQAPDVQEYIGDLRRQWPPEFVQKLYLGSRDEPLPTEPPPAAPAAPPAPVMPQPPISRPDLPVVRRTEPAAKDATAAAPPPREAAPAVPRPAPPAPVLARPVPPRPLPGPAVPAMPANAAGAWVATMLFFAGIAGAVGLFFLTLIWPLLDY